MRLITRTPRPTRRADRSGDHPGPARQAWAYVTKDPVTWREAIEGSAVISAGAVVIALGLGAALVRRRARSKSEA